ncbi:hypothetical protein O6R08_08070 [Cutibacterium equinum]|uniref:LppM domain-containing protein n=1 Tax=Cutibacterium equinum TaxID=3016342 RepID=A0ABY7QWN9_9ACTN|nr:hypothetical protein [Cutibacterium equinum]WCC79468.1 hypothetical protein O6R08_08070 [Cutibacterium equinum]
MVAVRRSARYLVALLMAPLLLLSGCGKFNAGFIITDEDHVTMTMTIGVLKSSLDKIPADEAEIFTNGRIDCSELEKTDEFKESAAGILTVKSFDDGKYVGCTMMGTGTVSELTGQPSSSPSSGESAAARSEDDEGDGPVFITFKGNKVRFLLDGSAVLDIISDFDSSGLAGSAGISDFKISVTFPGKVLSHSGSSKVDGKTVTWTDVRDLSSSSGLEASGERRSGFPGWAWMVLVVVVVAVGGAIAAVVTSKKKDGRQPGAPYQAGRPTQSPGASGHMGGQHQGFSDRRPGPTQAGHRPPGGPGGGPGPVSH